MFSRNVALWLVLLAGCAGAQKNVPLELASSTHSNLFVGHSESGSVVVAASHYDAMNGLATTSSELNLPDRKGAGNDMLCRREVVTGSHVPHWICRYNDDVKVARDQLQDWLDQPRLRLPAKGTGATMMLGHGPGGGGPAVP